MAQPDPMRPLSAVRRMPTIGEMQTAFDFEPLFEGNLTEQTYETTSHGDGSEWNLRRNRQAFDWIDVVRGGAPVSPS